MELRRLCLSEGQLNSASWRLTGPAVPMHCPPCTGQLAFSHKACRVELPQASPFSGGGLCATHQETSVLSEQGEERSLTPVGIEAGRSLAYLV